MSIQDLCNSWNPQNQNGPLFNGNNFSRFAENLGFRQQKITPLWLRGNALAENFMEPLGKAIKAATVEGHPWKPDIYKFLRNYRATPHCTTNIPPAKLLIGASTKFPKLMGKSANIEDSTLRERDLQQKDKIKFRLEACTAQTTWLQGRWHSNREATKGEQIKNPLWSKSLHCYSQKLNDCHRQPKWPQECRKMHRKFKPLPLDNRESQQP